MIGYAIVGGIGFLFLLLSFFIGELTDSIGGLFEHDVSIDVGGHDAADIHHDGEVHAGPSFFNVRMLASFATGFGTAGALAMTVGWNALEASLPALGSGVLLSLASYGFSLLLYRQQATSGYNTQELVGRLAEVITPIPVNGIGEVSLVVRGGYQHFAARSQDNQPIKAGNKVSIVAITGTTAVVKQQSAQ